MSINGLKHLGLAVSGALSLGLIGFSAGAVERPKPSSEPQHTD
jgi:hypothetical protein